MIPVRFSRSLLAAVSLKITTAMIIGILSAACSGQSQPPATPDPATVGRQVVAGFLTIPVAEVTLVSLEAKEFNDSSLGCPEPGMSYLQALTPGHRVVLEADGRRFDVRVSAGHGRICHRQKSPGATGRADESDDSPSLTSLVRLARQDLARRLDTDSAEISVLGIQPVDGRMVSKDCSLNCDGEAEQCGHIIALLHDGRRYGYHVDQQRISPCPPILAM